MAKATKGKQTKSSSAARKGPGKKTSATKSPAKKAPAGKTKAAAKVNTKAAAKAPAKKAATKTPPSQSGVKMSAGSDAKMTPASSSMAKRKLGLRGAAPWAARHAAKHAAEARARAAEPAPPGSARATIRVPSGAEEIKAKIAELHNQTQKVRTLRKRLDKTFFDVGQVLGEIQAQELYLAKGFGSFEAFLEREIDLGKTTALRLIKVSQVFQKDIALDYGVDRLFAALSALEGEFMPKAAPSVASNPGLKPPLPLKPPSRMVG